MGMAASQARLLAITARMHDVEYQAQSIQNAKVQLATQQDDAYRDYMAALDETTLTIKSGDALIPATFNNLCSHRRIDIGSLKESYAIRDKYGRLIVEDDIAKKYKDFMTKGISNLNKDINAPQAFAMYMLGINKSAGDYRKAEQSSYDELTDNGKNSKLVGMKEGILSLIGYPDPKNGKMEDIYDVNTKYLQDLKKNDPDKYNDTMKDYSERMAEFLYALYNATYAGDDNSITYGYQDIYTQAGGKGEVDRDLFNYYVTIYNEIQMCGDCISISEFNGTMGGDAANDSDWLKSKLESGEFSIENVTNNLDGTISMSGTAPSSDSRVSYTTTTDIDKKALKKAEAKYEKTLKDIDRKDKSYDMTLSKLETERTALKTEYDSVKKVIEDNIDRTFGIFS